MILRGGSRKNGLFLACNEKSQKKSKKGVDLGQNLRYNG